MTMPTYPVIEDPTLTCNLLQSDINLDCRGAMLEVGLARIPCQDPSGGFTSDLADDTCSHMF